MERGRAEQRTVRTRMNRALILGFVGCACWVVPTSAHEPDYEMRISAQHRSFAVGEPVKIDLDITNISSGERQFRHVLVRDAAEADSDIRVQDEVGRELPKSRYYRTLIGEDTLEDRLADRDHLPGHMREEVSDTLAPNESYHDGFVLTRLFDLSKPGTYVVQLSRNVPYRSGSYQITSNRLLVRIVPMGG